MRVPPAWCVKDTPQGLRDDDLISSSSKFGQSLSTQIVVFLAFLGNCPPTHFVALCRGWVGGTQKFFNGSLFLPSREDPLYGDGPRTGTRNLTGLGEAPHGAGAKGRPVHVPPAWCV